MPVTIRKYVRGYGVVDLPEGHPLLEESDKQLDWRGILAGCTLMIIVILLYVIMILTLHHMSYH